MSEIAISSLYALAVMLAMGVITWLYSLYRSDVSVVDSLWSLMFLAGAISYLTFRERLFHAQHVAAGAGRAVGTQAVHIPDHTQLEQGRRPALSRDQGE